MFALVLVSSLHSWAKRACMLAWMHSVMPFVFGQILYNNITVCWWWNEISAQQSFKKVRFSIWSFLILQSFTMIFCTNSSRNSRSAESDGLFSLCLVRGCLCPPGWETLLLFVPWKWNFIEPQLWNKYSHFQTSSLHWHHQITMWKLSYCMYLQRIVTWACSSPRLCRDL